MREWESERVRARARERARQTDTEYGRERERVSEMQQQVQVGRVLVLVCFMILASMPGSDPSAKRPPIAAAEGLRKPRTEKNPRKHPKTRSLEASTVNI